MSKHPRGTCNACQREGLLLVSRGRCSTCWRRQEGIVQRGGRNVRPGDPSQVDRLIADAKRRGLRDRLLRYIRKERDE